MRDMRIIITGGRNRDSQDDYDRMSDMLIDIGDFWSRSWGLVIIQGGCPDGIDALARRFAKEYDVPLETYPADFKQHPQDAVEVSNQTMVDHGAHLCLAFPNALADGPSLGTWDMIRRAVAAGVETRIYPKAGHEHG